MCGTGATDFKNAAEMIDGLIKRASFTNRALPRAAFTASLAILLSGLAVVEPRWGGDTWAYVAAGKRLWHWIVTGPLDWDVLIGTSLYSSYFLSSLIIGGVYMLPQAIAPYAAVTVNSILYSVTAGLYFKLWADSTPRIEHPLFALVVGLYILFGLVDVPIWNYYVLTDIFFLFCVGAFWFLLIRGVQNQSTIYWASALIVALLSNTVRPTGIVIPAFWLAAALSVYFYRRSIRFITVMVLVFVVPGIAALFIVPWLVFLKHNGIPWANGMIPDFDFLSFYREGIVVNGRYETYVPYPSEYAHYLLITILRFVYFFVPLRLGYSTVHNVMNLGYWIFLVWLMIVGGLRLRSFRDPYPVLAMLLILFSFYYGLFHAITWVAFDWRYQLPAMASAWLLAGFGLFSLSSKRAGPGRSARCTEAA